MLSVRYNRGLVRIMDIYGSNEVKKENNIDIVISSNVILPNEKEEKLLFQKGVLYSYGQTLVIDLQRSEEDIFKEIRKNTRYKINRASKRDSVIYNEITSPTDKEITEFVSFFNDFAPHKKIPRANLNRLFELRNNDSLIISYMSDEHLNPLCYHVYIITNNYCSLLHSASARFNNPNKRNLIGRANRLLHWMDIKSFRNMGIKWFDFGGLFVEPDENGERNINQFKMEFGGTVVDQVREFYSFSLLGKITVFLFWLKMRKRPDFMRAKKSSQ